MTVHTWRCRRQSGGVVCATLNLAVKKKCTLCGAPRPKRKQPAHRAVLNEDYATWVAAFGEHCGICGAGPGSRRLHRDHNHTTGAGRGLLCFRCNTALPARVDAAWLRAAAAYLERPPVDLTPETSGAPTRDAPPEHQ